MVPRYFLLLLLLSLVTSSFSQHKLHVTITQVDAGKGGSVLVALFDSPDSFLKNPIRSQQIKVVGAQSTLYFDLAEGEYALSVFQDANENKKLDTNFMGIPNEPYGFSNDAMGAFGPPSFEKAKIVLSGNLQTVIKLR